MVDKCQLRKTMEFSTEGPSPAIAKPKKGNRFKLIFIAEFKIASNLPNRYFYQIANGLEFDPILGYLRPMYHCTTLHAISRI